MHGHDGKIISCLRPKPIALVAEKSAGAKAIIIPLCIVHCLANCGCPACAFLTASEKIAQTIRNFSVYTSIFNKNKWGVMGYFRRLQSSIDFIENNLTEDITLADVAKEANCSLYHFHRLFKILVGSSVKEYIRKRRFTLAAKQLVETQKSVIDIAFDYRYGAPESFARAFKKRYGVSPLQYRKGGVFMPLNDKADLIKIYSAEQKRGIKIKPAVKEKDEFIVVGIELSTQYGSCQQDVPKFWKTFSKKESLSKLKNLKNPEQIFGICYGSCNGQCSDSGVALDSKAGEDGFYYLICSEAENLDDVPEGFAFRTIPKGRYAVFTFRISRIREDCSL